MPVKDLNPDNLGQDEDWEGNNAAFRCPICQKVFIVSHTRMHVNLQKMKGFRKCPKCGKSFGRITGGKKSGGKASLEWTVLDYDATNELNTSNNLHDK